MFLTHGHKADCRERITSTGQNQARVFDEAILEPFERVMFPDLRKIQAVPMLAFLVSSSNQAYQKMVGWSGMKFLSWIIRLISRLLYNYALWRNKRLIKKIQDLAPGCLVIMGHFHRHQNHLPVIILGGFGRIMEHDQSHGLFQNFQGFLATWGSNQEIDVLPITDLIG